MENILNPAFLSLCLQFYVSFGEEHCIEGSVTVSSLKVRLWLEISHVFNWKQEVEKFFASA